MLTNNAYTGLIILLIATICSSCIFFGDQAYDGKVGVAVTDNNVCFSATSYNPRSSFKSQKINEDFRLVQIRVDDFKNRNMWEISIPQESKANAFILKPDSCITYGEDIPLYSVKQPRSKPLSAGQYNVSMHVYNPMTYKGVSLSSSFELEVVNGKLRVSSVK